MKMGVSRGKHARNPGTSSLAGGYEGQAGKSQGKRTVCSRHGGRRAQRPKMKPDSVEKLKESQNG